ncbi:MAG: hypothetical protein F6J95_027240 [Leptolyngbya sp. SIO1E4]|nr:hypothetical protein [Leptolyngbya sp. SIO1E4]
MTGVLQTLGLGLGVFSVIGWGWAETALSQPSETSSPAISLSWQRIREFFSQENDDPGSGGNHGSRPPVGLCLVSPRQGETLWHRNPVMVWQGYATVGVRLQGDGETVLWKETASEPETDVYRAYYQGEQLQLGEEYEWLFYIISQGSPAIWFPFEVMAADMYEQHAAELAALQSELEAEGADEEAIALARANYFLDNGLSSDALQAVFAVGEPSEALLETRAALVEEICAIE